MRRDQDIKGCGKQIFKSASRSIVKRSWMKLGEIIEDYKMFLFSKFQKKMICFVRVWSFENFVSDLFFWSYIFCLNIFESEILGFYKKIKDYICERNFISFRYVLGEIQVSKISTLILKSVSFESDNFLWSSSIDLKFRENIQDISIVCFLGYQGVWSYWERVISHFVFKS